MMRPMAWGTIWFVIGLVGWAFFVEQTGDYMRVGAKLPGMLRFLVNLFSSIFFFSMPVAFAVELIQRRSWSNFLVIGLIGLAASIPIFGIVKNAGADLEPVYLFTLICLLTVLVALAAGLLAELGRGRKL